jgi:hypothetical protein
MKPARDPDRPDLAALAKRFMDLWQEQMTALAGDSELADNVARFLKALPPGMPFWPGFRDPGQGAAADRPAAAAPPSGERRRDLEQLASRLRAVEERLARLEAGTRGGSRRPASKPKKRRA